MPEKGGRHAGRVLVVDDDEQLRRACGRYLTRLGHRVDTAASSEDAMALLERADYDVVLTDLQLPGSSGLQLLEVIRARGSDSRAILMSGVARATDAALAIEYGVDRLLLKPFRLPDLHIAVEKAIAERRAQQQVAQDREVVDELVRQRESESRHWILRSAHALAKAVEAKDAYTAGHAARVSAYAVILAESIGGIDLSRFRLAGDLHDVGKIGVPDAVLNKPGRLDEDEFALIQEHPETGARILEPLIEDAHVIGVVRSHHERWDGRGYPDGLEGERIPLAARVLAVADTLDAMTSSRAYRRGMPWEVAVAEIRRCTGSQFDPRVVEVFEQALPELAAQYRSFEDEQAGTAAAGL